MNERIQQLKEQAMEWVPNRVDPDTKIRLLNAEKFAELIVQKCADIGERYADGNYEVRNQIMAHFGLEEE